jgi:putative DNA primase/helicase
MSELANRCRDRWPSILPALGIILPKKMLLKPHRNGPCPVCAGVDRFQFTDKDGSGRWYCRGCGEGGDGIRLVERVLGLGFHEAACRIEEVLGIRPRETGAPIIIAPLPEKIVDINIDTDAPLQPWRKAGPLTRSTAGSGYFESRGLALTDAEMAALRFRERAWHWPSQSWLPCVVALVAMHDGTGLCGHQTFVRPNGTGKAEVERPRLFPKGARPIHGGVWFGRANPKLEFLIAEGIETVLSALRLCAASSGCAAVSALGLSKLILPPEARRVRIFADRDADGKGLRAAREAQQRWQGEGRQVRVSQPNQLGDANDILRRRLGL